jgi:hypothetical protein
MVSLLVICAPFGPAVDLLSYFLLGPAYCLFLALFAVGLGLATPSRILVWWLLSFLVPLLVIVDSLLSFWVCPEVFLSTPPAVFLGLLGVLGAWVLASCAVAGSGWVRYVRWHRSARGA